jgi:DNA-binding NarL/FixJ family response regulator
LLVRAELWIAAGRQDAARSDLADAHATLEPLRARPALERAAAISDRLPEPQPTDDLTSSRYLSASRVVVGPPTQPTPGGLSPREVEVLRLVARGLTDAEVGTRLFISPRTVARHLQSVYTKLRVNSRTAAAAFAFERGMV